MLIKHSSLLILMTGFIFLFSCKKEPTEWDTKWAAPIAHGHLTIDDMMPVKYTEVNEDGYLSLVINESILEFSLDTLIELPDTTIAQKVAIAFPSLEVTPGFSLPDVFNQAYELDEIELKRVIVESGLAEISLASPWAGKTKVTISSNKIESPDGNFEHIYFLDAGTIESPSMAGSLIDMTLHDMDLTGPDDVLFNTISGELLIESNEEIEAFTITNSDSITVLFSFTDLVPRYAQGYFGQYHFSDTTGFSLEPMKKVIDGTIDIDSINLNLSIRNGFNLIAQSRISKVTGINTRTNSLSELSFAELHSTLNIDPASGGLYDYVPSQYNINISNTNSNITTFLENLSDSLVIGYELDVNPFGNITAGSDEFFPDSKMELFLEGEFPMNFGANDLTIVDTLTVTDFTNANVSAQNGTIIMEYENAFPLEADAKLYLLDEDNVIVDSLIGTSPIQSGTYMEDDLTTIPSKGSLQFNVDSEAIRQLETTKRLVVQISFTSYGTEKVKITPDTYFDFKLRTENLQLRISI